MHIIGVREKLLVAFLGVTSIVLLVSGGVFFFIAQGLLKDQIYHRLTQASVSVSTQIGDRLHYLEELIGEAAGQPDLESNIEAIDNDGTGEAHRALSVILEDAREAADEILDLALFTPDGKFVGSARRKPVVDELTGPFGKDIRERRIAWRWQVHSRPGLELGYSLTSGKKEIGILVAVIDPLSLRQLVSGLAQDDDLFDVIISHPSENNEPVPLVTSRDIDIEKPDMRLNPFLNKGALRFVDGATDFRGKEVLAVLNTVRDFPLGVTIKAEDDVVLAPLKEEKLTFLLLIVGSFALALMVTYVLSVFLSKPILDMARVASLIASGDFEKRIRSFSRDEMGILARALNQMGERLLDMRSKLQVHFDEKADDMERLNKGLMEFNEELRELSSTDSLTQLANRREFDAILKKEWQRARRNGSWLALCMIDVDYFKQYNDSLGHDAGDEALKKVAGAIEESCRRPAELAARLGGEEFGALLPGADPEQALQQAERIRLAVVESAVPHPDSEVSGYLTVSVGVFAFVPESNAGIPAFLAQADKALYKAKESGRNRVAQAND